MKYFHEATRVKVIKQKGASTYALIIILLRTSTIVSVTSTL